MNAPGTEGEVEDALDGVFEDESDSRVEVAPGVFRLDTPIAAEAEEGGDAAAEEEGAAGSEQESEASSSVGNQIALSIFETRGIEGDGGMAKVNRNLMRAEQTATHIAKFTSLSEVGAEVAKKDKKALRVVDHILGKDGSSQLCKVKRRTEVDESERLAVSREKVRNTTKLFCAFTIQANCMRPGMHLVSEDERGFGSLHRVFVCSKTYKQLCISSQHGK